MQEVLLDPKVVFDLIKNYPNDMELGKKIRTYYLEELEKQKNEQDGKK